MYMDYRDFDAAVRIVSELKNTMKILPEAQTHPRPFRAIMGDLTDFLFHIYHHTLGGRAIACDLDFVEVREGRIAALIELKKRGRTMSPTQELVTGAISKALDVPVYLISTNDTFTQFFVDKHKSQKKLRLDRKAFYDFMQEFEDPATRMDEVM